MKTLLTGRDKVDNSSPVGMDTNYIREEERKLKVNMKPKVEVNLSEGEA